MLPRTASTGRAPAEDLGPCRPTPDPRSIDIVETHVSVLIFVGDRVYKARKKVRTPFLDFSTRELRAADCHREVELNRRLAPRVYLGVLDLVDDSGAPVEHMVLMSRLPEDRRLSTMIAAPDFDPAGEERPVDWHDRSREPFPRTRTAAGDLDAEDFAVPVGVDPGGDQGVHRHDPPALADLEHQSVGGQVATTLTRARSARLRRSSSQSGKWAPVRNFGIANSSRVHDTARGVRSGFPGKGLAM